MIIKPDRTRHPKITDSHIDGFFGDYRFLSNYHVCDLVHEGIKYTSSEHAYMAMKTLDEKERWLISQLETPSMARAYGQQMDLRPNWNRIRVQMMLEVLFSKFQQNPHLYAKLLETSNKILRETNNWHDTFWGVDWITGEGENHLGRCLMTVRSSLL